MKVAVTGASGFVGGAVCQAAAAAGWEVHAFGRRPRAALGTTEAAVTPSHGRSGRAGRFGVGRSRGGLAVAATMAASYRSWDITRPPPDDLPEVDAVIHCAGTVTDWGPSREFFEVNAHGTLRVRQAFPGARFVHVSTASVYDPLRPTVMAREDECHAARYVNAYGASKALAERLVRDTAVVLRPHAIYGPGDRTLLPRLLGAVRGGRLWAVGTGRQRISLTSVGNLAQACLQAAAGPVETGVFNVTDADPVVLDDALRAFLRERGVAARPAYLPAAVAGPLAAVAETAFHTLGRSRPPRLTRYGVGHLAVERTLDITAARHHLGYRPTPTSFQGAATW
ncbi:NAD-dependent epimerase [Sphaerisporangium melleum]|uniref:NAD-dependent epimerase n=1 Tax=Sphaerisporangium melleum TaxID=321316 RepID=A0A917VP60_9ACTN|nr:NAD-dependent epimerase/dehydratase family protein [Sphaerisporangium melleum]GGL00812.1 NAD-dependent epimerase [Sphaerisporangium melleum]GII71603.1 NAD-dependent epimerase [Sphaerisporangium melleum]